MKFELPTLQIGQMLKGKVFLDPNDDACVKLGQANGQCRVRRIRDGRSGSFFAGRVFRVGLGKK